MWEAVDGGAWFIRDGYWDAPQFQYCANSLLHKVPLKISKGRWW